MKASNIFWLASCVCLPVLLLFPHKAEPTARAPEQTRIVTAPPTLVAPKLEVPASRGVHVVLVRGQDRLVVDLPFDGNVSDSDADAIAQIMSDPRSGRTRRIAQGTLALLADVAARFPNHEIEVVSAVRAEPDRSRAGIKHSKHWSGHAIDLIVRGAKQTEVRDAMWANHRDIGVGWYPQSGFIHIDYRPDVHDTAWTQPRKNADNVYHPRWSRKADKDLPNFNKLVRSIRESLGIERHHNRNNA
jgi:uncharacterized protein YcbK (DUF882 family)